MRRFHKRATSALASCEEEICRGRYEDAEAAHSWIWYIWRCLGPWVVSTGIRCCIVAYTGDRSCRRRNRLCKSLWQILPRW